MEHTVLDLGNTVVGILDVIQSKLDVFLVGIQRGVVIGEILLVKKTLNEIVLGCTANDDVVDGYCRFISRASTTDDQTEGSACVDIGKRVVDLHHRLHRNMQRTAVP